MKLLDQQVSTRAATVADADFLWKLHRSTMAAYVDRTWGWEDAWQKHHFRQRLDQSDYEIVLLDGQPVGCRAVRWYTGRIFLAVLEILPEFQRRGIGTALLRQVLRDASSVGLPIELHVLKVNPAIRLYRRLGFRRVSETAAQEIMRCPAPRSAAMPSAASAPAGVAAALQANGFRLAPE